MTGVYDASNDSLSVYVGTTLEKTCPLPAADPPMASGGSIVMGRAQWFGQDVNWFNGNMNSVKVFAEALSPAQIPLAINYK